MSDCTDTIALENLDFCPNDEIVAGISELEIFGAAVSDFETIATPPDLKTATTLEEAATITEAHVFKEGRGFHRMEIFSDTGAVENTQLGEKGGLGAQNSLKGAIPNNTKGKGYLRKYKNQAMIFLVREKTGNLVQLGSRNSPARLSEFTGTTGTAPGDAKNIQVVFMDSQPYLAPEYKGTIQEFPAPAPGV